MYAAGKIPGSFFKREGRAGEKGILTARMIDRPIRPLFPKGWRYDTQLVAIPMSIDHVHPYDILAMNGASAALMVSDIPIPSPVGAVRIGKVEGNFVVNPQRGGPPRRRPSSTSSSPAPRTRSSWSRPAPPRSPRPRCSTRSTSPTTRSRSSAPPSASWPRRPARRSSIFEAPKVDQGLLDAIRASHGARLDDGDAGRGQARAPGRDEGRRGRRPRGPLRRPRLGGLRRAEGRSSRRSTPSRRRSSASASPSTRSARTAARRARSARSTSRSPTRRARTAPRSSRAARRRRSASPPSAR